MDELFSMSAVALKAEIEKRNVGIEELTRAYINRIEKYNDKLSAVCEINESAIYEARKLDSEKSRRDSIFFGLPVLVKDNIDAAGLHTTAGSLALADNIAEKNADVIENIIRNGGIILGKTNMTEFANFVSNDMPNGYSSRGGRVKNAYDCNKDPSGSSTGSAVALSAGFCAAAVGTDTSFSVVACASENGVAGLKPRFGSLSSKGIVPISCTLDSAGAFGRNLSDAVLLYSAMSDKPVETVKAVKPIQTENLKIGVNLFNKNIVSEAQIGRYEKLFERMQNGGAKISEFTQAYTPFLRTLMQYEFKRDLERYLSSAATKMKRLDDIIACYKANPDTMMKYGISYLEEAAEKSTDDENYKYALAQRAEMRGKIIKEISEYDACVMTGPTNIMHFAGLPSLSVKLCTDEEKIPHGIILYGNDERRLLSAALTIESYCEPFEPPCLEKNT